VVPPSFFHAAGETRFLLPLCPCTASGDRSGNEDEGERMAESVSGFSPKPQKKSFVYTILNTPQALRWG